MLAIRTFGLLTFLAIASIAPGCGEDNSFNAAVPAPGGNRGGAAGRSAQLGPGSWAGASAELRVSDVAAGIPHLDCAEGRFDRVPVLDPNGAFHETGTLMRIGGPVPIGGFHAQPAFFDGQVNGDRMTLRVRWDDGLGDAIDKTYRLVRGRAIEPFACAQ